MSQPQSCQPCCTTTQNVQVPGVAGSDGAAGADGTNGVNAYTVTTADFVVPAVGGTVVVSVANSTWMVFGQSIYVGGNINAAAGTGGAHFKVSSIPTTTSVVLEFSGYEDDVAVGTTMDSGDGVSPGGIQPTAITASKLSEYRNVSTRGNAHTFSETPEALNFSGTDLGLTINETGNWMMMARIRVDYSFATYSADGKVLNLKLRRINNSAADLSNTTVSFLLRDLTTAYQTAGFLHVPVVFYNTTNTDDEIAIFGWLDSGDLPDNDPDGRIIALEASLVAVKVAEAS